MNAALEASAPGRAPVRVVGLQLSEGTPGRPPEEDRHGEEEEVEVNQMDILRGGKGRRERGREGEGVEL